MLFELMRSSRRFVWGLFLVLFATSFLVAPFSDSLVSQAFANEEEAVATEGATEAVESNEWKPQPPPNLELKDYPVVAGFNGRIVVWFVAQLHLFFAAFVLGVPIFVWVIEIIGVLTKDERYDRMAHEFQKVAMTGFSLAASFGGLLTLSLLTFYPDFMKYMASVFGETMIYYALMFFVESFFLYTYYYGWDKMKEGKAKYLHIALGLGLNMSGLVIMLLSNSWTSFMMSPAGLDEAGAFAGSTYAAMHNFLWSPLNIHRFIANIAYGGSLTAAYAAYKFLTAEKAADKAHYDWMGYTSFLVAVVGLLPLPFAGYWLTKEVYDYSQQMGITLMGGVFAWLFIMQAVLIGAIFLSANYYLWCSLGRSHGADRFRRMIPPLAWVIVIAFLLWFTPHTLVMTSKELSQIGGAHHPILGVFGVMAAKNTSVNTLILATFLSYQIFSRSNVRFVGDNFWAKNGTVIQVALYGAAMTNIVGLGVYSYFIPASVRIGLSVPQVVTTVVVLVVATIIDLLMSKHSEELGESKWGNMPVRSQYAL
ncbi:hypothetical protein MNBD_NITROSPINAE01-1202, partial [hydrothermal vent metagenome]